MKSTQGRKLNPIWARALVSYRYVLFTLRTRDTQDVLLNYTTGEVTPIERER